MSSGHFIRVSEKHWKAKGETMSNILPTAEVNPAGLHKKYVISRADGDPIDPNAVYFVLRLDGGHLHNVASRAAALDWCECVLAEPDNALTKTARELAAMVNKLS